jgi:hypothetical protein
MVMKGMIGHTFRCKEKIKITVAEMCCYKAVDCLELQ